MVKKLGVFLMGAAAGAAVVYFTSPRSGFENRNLAKDTANAVLESANIDCSQVTNQAVQAAQAAQEMGQDLAKQATERTHEFYATANTKMQEVISGAAPAAESDDLRKKIEEARQRIAAQVVKNAEEAQLVDAEAVSELVVDAEAEVEDAADTETPQA